MDKGDQLMDLHTENKIIKTAMSEVCKIMKEDGRACNEKLSCWQGNDNAEHPCEYVNMMKNAMVHVFRNDKSPIICAFNSDEMNDDEYEAIERIFDKAQTRRSDEIK